MELANPLAQYGQVANIQSAQNQNALAQYQLATAQREQESTNALNEAYRSAYNPQTGEIDINTLRKTLSTGGFGSKLPGLEKTFGELEKQKLEALKLKGEVTAQPTKLEAEKASLVDAKLKQSRQFLDTINPVDPNAPAAYLAWHEANHKDPVLGPLLEARGVTADQSRARIERAIAKGPQEFADLLNASKLGTEKFMELNKPQYITENLGGTSRVTALPGLGGAPTKVSEVAKTATPGERMVDARARENIAISQTKLQREGDPAFQQTMASAKATGEAIAKNDVAAKQALPRIISDAQMALDVVDQMVGKQEVRDSKGKLIQAATKPHPGFENAVGATWVPGARFVPGTDAAGFQALQDQIEGTAFLSAFEALKGGGAISEKEGTKATAARMRMTLAQDEKEYVKAAREFQEIVRTGVQNAQRKAGGATPSVAPTNAANIDALLDKYK
jgi:hypothetical protein